ncbi:hypothetical protein ACFIJ5_18485 (plasmid) [Haloimpatiens sp. FM7330]|uniref:hypothetical protein n=1 Tax=Haloimpatiens sp. FM7330 TaxID=3298610 RepID=UPI00363E57F0
MSECIKKWIKISNIEDLGKFKYIIFLVIVFFSLFAFPEYAFVSLLLYVATLGYQMLSLHKRNNVEDLLLTSHLSKTSLILSMFSTCILSSLYILPLLVIILMIRFNASIKIAIIIALIDYLYANSIGVLIGSFVKNHLAGISIIFGYFVLLTGGSYYLRQENIRYLSVLLQLNDIKNLYWSNLIGLLGFAILFIALSILIYGKNKTAVKFTIVLSITALLIIGGNFYNDVNMRKEIKNTPYSTLKIENNEIKYRKINPKLANKIGRIVYSFQDKIKEFNLPIPFYKVNITKEVYFFYDKVSAVTPNKNNILQINMLPSAVNNFKLRLFLAELTPAIIQTKSNYTNIQQDIIECVKYELQYKTIISNKYNIFTDYDINKAKSKHIERKRYYSLISKEYGKSIDKFINYIIEKHPDKLKDIYTLCIIENKPKTQEEFYNLVNKIYPNILYEYKGGNVK